MYRISAITASVRFGPKLYDEAESMPDPILVMVSALPESGPIESHY